MAEYDTARDSFEANLIDENERLKAELAALKPRLAVRQTDTDCAIAIRALISEGYNDGDIECVIRAHVASETEPWRKRCEEADRLLRNIKSVIRESQGISGWHLNCETAEWGEFEFDREIDAYLATHPATGGGDAQQ